MRNLSKCKISLEEKVKGTEIRVIYHLDNGWGGLGYLREEIGDVEALSDESEEALESFALLRIELAVEERSDIDVLGIVVEMSIGADPEHSRGSLAQRFRRRSELREHHFFLISELIE